MVTLQDLMFGFMAAIALKEGARSANLHLDR